LLSADNWSTNFRFSFKEGALRHLSSGLLSLSAIAALAACSGGTVTPPSHAGTAVPLHVSVHIPDSASSATRGRAFVSPSTKGVKVTVTHDGVVFGTAAIDASPGSASCVAETGGRKCTATLNVPKGKHHVKAEMHDVSPSEAAWPGNTLSVNESDVDVAADDTTSDLPASQGTGVASSLSIAVTPQTLENPASQGALTAPQSITVTVNAQDASGSPIAANSLANPITLTVYGPSPNPVVSPQSATVDANGKATFTYTGGYFENAMTIAAVSGTASATTQLVPSHPVCTIPASDTGFPIAIGGDNLKNGWKMKIKVGEQGVSEDVEVDTGSRGLVFPRSKIGADAIGPGAEGQMEYTSDGKIFHGHYFLAPIVLDVGGKNVQTVPVEVLGVEYQTCDPKFPKCQVDPTVDHMGNMGVAFDRPESSGGPDTNPFLQLKDVLEGRSHAGYIITQDGITLGLSADRAAGFSTMKLDPAQPVAGRTFFPGDWTQPPVCFSFPQYGTKEYCGQMLMDTGIGSMIVNLPPDQRPAEIANADPLPDGLEIRIAAPDASAPVMDYSFTLGEGTNPMAPTASAEDPAARWADASSTPSVNTGRHVVAGYDYMYDASCGRIGYKRI
jgi:hypothetical protein